MDTVHIQHMRDPGADETAVEIVERKGLGYPDTVCDAVMEHIAQALSRAYLERFGTILHYNCDKGLLVAGQVERRFGGGSVVEPRSPWERERVRAVLNASHRLSSPHPALSRREREPSLGAYALRERAG